MSERFVNEFIREETHIDRDFTIVSNAWISDQRIVGNPLSIYLWIRAQAVGFKVGRSSIMKALALGKSAFQSAIGKLEECGYLERVVDRWPAGAKTADGRQLGGAPRVRYRVLEPNTPGTQGKSKIVPAVAPEPEVSGDEPHENNGLEPKVENRHEVIHKPKPKAENRPRVIHRPDGEEVDQDTVLGKPQSENPTSGSQPLNKTKDKQNKSSSSGSNQTTAHAGFVPDDDDDDFPVSNIEASQTASRNAFGVDERELRDALAGTFGVERVASVNLTDLSVTVLSRSAQQRVAHPTRFVLAAVLNAPDELLGASTQEPALPAPPAASNPMEAVARLCAATGHQWDRTDHGAVCRRCGIHPDEIPDPVREACEARTAGAHVLGGQQLCRTCGHDDLAGLAVSARKAG